MPLRTIQNCIELNKFYKCDVAKGYKVKNKGSKTNYKPYVSADLYNSNKSKECDKGGIACEK